MKRSFLHQFTDFKEENQWALAWPFVLLCIPYLLGLSLPLMDVDASQYASISLEMLTSGSWLEIYHRGDNYLDKPPLLFWAAAFSYKIFGVSDFAYRLPSLLSTILGVYSTFQLGRLLYNFKTGYIAAVILASTQAFFLINHDIRTDTLLINCTIFAIWQIQSYLTFGKWHQLLLGGLGIALAMLSKGPLGLMVPMLAFIAHWIYTKQWKNFLKWEWLIILLELGVLLAPMTYGLFTQYGWEGPRFYFWTQSFGRITGENEWRNDLGPDFFIHTMLWSFLPWTIFWIPAFYREAKQILSREMDQGLTFFGFILPFLVLSASKFKLPHYIYPLLPFAAISSARFLDLRKGKLPKVLGILMPIFLTLLLILPGYLSLVAFPEGNRLWQVIGYALLLAGIVIGYIPKVNTFLAAGVLYIVGLNVVMNGYVYPKLIAYQSPSSAIFFMQEMGFETDKLMTYQLQSHSLDFYARRWIPEAKTKLELDSLSQDHTYLFTDVQNIQSIEDAGLDVEVIQTFPHWHVTMVTLPFLNPSTRTAVLKERALLQIRG